MVRREDCDNRPHHDPEIGAHRSRHALPPRAQAMIYTRCLNNSHKRVPPGSRRPRSALARLSQFDTGAIRVSVYAYTTLGDVYALCAALEAAVSALPPLPCSIAPQFP